MTVARLIVVVAAFALFALDAAEASAAVSDAAQAAQAHHKTTTRKTGKAAAKTDKTGKLAKPKDVRHAPRREVRRGKVARKEVRGAVAVPKGATKIALPMPAPRVSRGATSAIPLAAPSAAMPTRPAGPTLPLSVAGTAITSPIDLTAVKQAIQLVRKDRADEATSVERTITDPLARKLVEFVILRSDDTRVDFSRYAAFLAANPTWPSQIALRQHAEAALWEQQIDPQTTIGFFATQPPLTAKGNFALARAWLAKGDSGRAYAAVSAAWRNNGFSEDLEAQARQMFAGLITPADDKVRMDTRFYVEDVDAAMRAARHLDAAQLAIARARAAVIDQSGNAKALLAAVPASVQRDPGYMFSLIQWLRRNDRIKEAAQWMLTAPRDAAALINPDQWWTERRLIARKLLDLGDVRTAYEIAAGAAPPTSENPRAEQQFTAGWIALEFLHQPALALPHFARIADGVINPITLARSYYWQGRAAAALGRAEDARADYEAAAHYPTAYYGQLARAALHLDDVTLRDLRPPAAERRPLEMARVFDILYAIDERDMVAGMAADIADKSADVAGLATLAAITASHNDARATLLIGKTALGRGLPFANYAFPDFGVPNYAQIGPAVERCVVYSIVRQESAFDTRVVSSAHALGLMQVTPSAGRNTARKFKVPFDQHRLLSDVAYNAQLGTAELGADINAFRGSYILAFVAYNAGPGRAAQWIEQYGDPRDRKVDPIDWIERIPISETRYYVQRVLENMQVYRARLENNPQLLIDADMRRGS